MLLVIDSGASNVKCVAYALGRTRVEMEISARADDLRPATAIILPWWGEPAAGLQALNDLGLLEPLKLAATKGTPILGVGDGALLLASTLGDSSNPPGLGLIPGRLVKLPLTTGRSAPHFGWNTILIKTADPLVTGIPINAHFYFCQFYRFDPDDVVLQIASASWNDDCPVLLRHQSVVGALFEPDKSGEMGIKVLVNFVASLDGLNSPKAAVT